MSRFSESVVEDAALGWLKGLGWRVEHGQQIAPGELAAERTDYGQVVLEQRLRDALARLNPQLPAEAIHDAFRKLIRPEGPALEARNRAVHRLLVDGVTVEYRAPDGAIRGAQAQVIDFDDADNNGWLAVNQFTVCENKHTRRPDVVLFINGLPLALVELKNAADATAAIWSAFQQFQTYKAELPTLFAFNALLVVSDGVEARIGTFTAGREWFKPWRTIGGETLAPTTMPELQVLMDGVFDKRRLLDMIGHFIVFEDVGAGPLAKKMAGYHQFHAVRVAVAETLRAARLDHFAEPTQGYESGRRPGGDPATDPLDWQPHIRNKPRREALANRFRDARDRLKLVLVRDMWLTGFDAPSLHTMYVDKPMRGHGLMQAIARVNRVFRDKPGGLVVDYLGLAHELKAAAGHLHRERRHGKDGHRPTGSGCGDAGEVRDLLRSVPRLQLVEMGDGSARRAAGPLAAGSGAHPRAGGRQKPVAPVRSGLVAGVCARRAA
jgi:type I site-specific restriction-modification system R (restriction) subunit